jgi:hypothetical protein
VPEVNSARVAMIKVLGTKQLRTHVLAAKGVRICSKRLVQKHFALRVCFEKASFAPTWLRWPRSQTDNRLTESITVFQTAGTSPQPQRRTPEQPDPSPQW